MEAVTVQAEMGEGDAPAAVKITVTQGAVLIREAEVPADNPQATFEMDPGDYVVHAQSLVPHGAPADAVFAVPVKVTAR